MSLAQRPGMVGRSVLSDELFAGRSSWARQSGRRLNQRRPCGFGCLTKARRSQLR